ncbi:MAG: hypothetical protein LQ338_007453 [Usnochroma carphineum]|nr:MAG: hypothetical protein LQ338_007453 [Usnochroma carphineum]
MEEQKLPSACRRLRSEALILAAVSALISNASISNDPLDNRLAFPRAYSIALAPHLIYTRSNLLPALVASKVYRQLEFLAVGSWWIYNKEEDVPENANGAHASAPVEGQPGTLRKIPGGREDVFADKSIDLRSTRSLMKFLKLAADAEAYPTVLPEWGERPFSDYLDSQFKIDSKLQAPLLALALSPDPPSKTTVAYALPRIHRHLTSIGIFGPGFGAVLPKWGGLAEIAQVACRAGAVGGGVYVLKSGIESIKLSGHASTTADDTDSQLAKVKLQGGDVVKARWIVGTAAALYTDDDPLPQTDMVKVHHLTAIVSSPLTALFPPPAEGSPPPAGVVVSDLLLPPYSLSISLPLSIRDIELINPFEGKGIIYTSTHLSHPSTALLLKSAMDIFLDTLDESPRPKILWSLFYTQHHPTSSSTSLVPDTEDSTTAPDHKCDRILCLRDLSPSLALEDEVLRDVRAAWEVITADDGEARGGFLQFEEREGVGAEDDEEGF